MAERNEIVKWGDEAMFEAQPMLKEGSRVTPAVFLLSATPDPLGAIASAFRMYAGIPTYDLRDITDEERKQYWEESLVTNLKAAWEFVDFHFFIEGVTRAFTHQAVRQRTAVYAQESLRFAVKRGFAQEAALPPGVATNEGALAIWERMLGQMEEAYNQLINSGIPAEDARGLLPHCVTTRMNYKTNFRNLIETLGNRLCTQAQFEWRAVVLGYMNAIRNHHDTYWDANEREWDSDWMFETLGSPLAETFTPVCYKAGKCVFMGKLDRGCTIRDRVNAFAEAGVPSNQWSKGASQHYFGDVVPNTEGMQVEGGRWIPGIEPEEWAANPWAGITDESNPRPQ